jgi:hypothetical protein
MVSFREEHNIETIPLVTPFGTIHVWEKEVERRGNSIQHEWRLADRIRYGKFFFEIDRNPGLLVPSGSLMYSENKRDYSYSVEWSYLTGFTSLNNTSLKTLTGRKSNAVSVESQDADFISNILYEACLNDELPIHGRSKDFVRQCQDYSLEYSGRLRQIKNLHEDMRTLVKTANSKIEEIFAPDDGPNAYHPPFFKPTGYSIKR